MTNARDLSFLPALSRAASATGPSHDCYDLISGVAYLNVTACAGGSDALDVIIEESADNVIWYTNISFTQATAATTEKKALVAPFGRYLRAKGTNAAGTTAAYEVLATLKGA